MCECASEKQGQLLWNRRSQLVEAMTGRLGTPWAENSALAHMAWIWDTLELAVRMYTHWLDDEVRAMSRPCRFEVQSGAGRYGGRREEKFVAVVAC